MAMRDLARYRARSGSALGAISVGVLIAMVVIIASASRFSNVLDYAGPNVSSTQLIVYTLNGPYGPGGPGNAGAGAGTSTTSIASMSTSAHQIASALGSHEVVTLETTSATIQHAAPGRSYSGPSYVATPQLLKDFAIKKSAVEPTAEILSMRPGFAALSNMQIVYGNYFAGAGKGWPSCVGVPEERLSREPFHPGDDVTARRNVSPQHRDHRVRSSQTRADANNVGLVDRDGAAAECGSTVRCSQHCCRGGHEH